MSGEIVVTERSSGSANELGRMTPSSFPKRVRRPWSARLMLGALAMFGAIFSARPASAYCRTTACPTCPYDESGCPTGIPLVWPSSCVSFSMQFAASKQADLATATTVMEKAFGAWENVACPDTGSPPTIHLDRRFGNVGCDLHEYNQTDANANIIMFRDDVWPYEGGGNILALTTVTYSRKSGEIFDVDMEVNATQPLSTIDPVPTSSYDLQSIVTHEAGHFLGMAHSLDRRATMFSMYSSGTDSFRVLSPDDITGICFAYPSDRGGVCDFGPRGGFSPECGIFPSAKGGRCSISAVETSDRGSNSAFAILAVSSVLGISRRYRRRSARSARA